MLVPRSSLIKPSAPFEPQERDEGAQTDDSKRNGVAPRPIQLRHEFEIHPVNPDYYCRRYADNRHDREHLEQIVFANMGRHAATENSIAEPAPAKGRGERVARPSPIFRIRMVISAGAGDEGYCSQTRHDGLLGRNGSSEVGLKLG